jgi:N-methylhydantoinase A/oxoprolinase/acetone carboxylase beta subunit
MDCNLDSNKQSEIALVLGIDTGGTYTDAVLLDYNSRKVLASQKSLTTKRDFSIGIEKVIEGIEINNPGEIQMVSVSTTLATNAIAEGKGKRVALFLIGYDPDLVDSFNLDHQFSTPNYYYFEGGHDLLGQEKETLALGDILEKVNDIKTQVDAIAVSSYFSPLNPEHEIRANDAISRICDLPVVLGHQLSTRLGSIERATTAALNASLLAVLQDFIIAVRRAVEHRGIDAPLMVVRGDGTLMSAEFAVQTPVETIHSGPAASAIGGKFLSNMNNALIVDVGGTTTDLALILDGEVTISETGASVSGFKTSIQAANLLSIGLGGDSQIVFDQEMNFHIGPQRVVPISFLANKYPKIEKRLAVLKQKTWPPSSPNCLEYWFLIRNPKEEAIIQSTRQRKLIRILDQGPYSVPELIKEMELLHLNQLGADELLRQEIIGRAGFTPTDLLHIDGRYSPWSVTAAQSALILLSHYLNLAPDELKSQIWARINEMILQAIVEFLSEKKIKSESQQKGDFGNWIFRNSLYSNHPHLNTQIKLRYPVIGIGAPAEIMLPNVAEILHTRLVLPDYYFVANAAGAVAGSVMVSENILVYPKLTESGSDIMGYIVQARENRDEFEELADALSHAKKLGKKKAISGALLSGAENPQVLIEETSDGLDTYRLCVKAFGNPRLGR